MEPKKFKDLGIPPHEDGFIGEKIEVKRILNKSVTVHKFKVNPSKHNTGRCATVQLTVDGNSRVMFTGSNYLIDDLEKVKKEDLPFITTIISDDNSRLIFT